MERETVVYVKISVEELRKLGFIGANEEVVYADNFEGGVKLRLSVVKDKSNV